MNVYIIYLALVRAALLGFGSAAAYPHISVNLMCPSWLASALWRCLVLQGIFQHLGYLLALDSQPLSSMDSLEESDLENFVDFFCTSELLVIYRPKSSEVSLMSAQLAVFVQLFLSLFSLFSSANLQNFRKVCLATEGMSQEVLYLPSVIFVS